MSHQILPMRSMGKGTAGTAVEGSSDLFAVAVRQLSHNPSTMLRMVPLPTCGREDIA